MSGIYEVYSTRPGASESKTWRWVLTPEGTGSRREAAQIVKDVKARDAALKVLVYVLGSYKYTIA